MLQPTEEVYRAIVNLEKSNPESFAMFVDWMSRSFMGHLMVAAQTEKDVHARWMQGRCQELGDLMQFINTAAVQLENMNAKVSDEPEVNKFD
jgi:hypothetical protein